jgi:transcriptional regulator with XRE-family HTH domain
MAPRRSNKNPTHPLQQIRLSVGLTQADFARRLGISQRAIESIEEGTRRKTGGIDGKLAASVAEVFGARRGTFERPGLSPKTWLGKPYPAKATSFLKDFELRKAKMEDRAWRQAKYLLRVVDLVLQAAHEKRCLGLLRLSLAEWARHALERFALRKTFESAHARKMTFEDVLRERMLVLTAEDRRWLKRMTGYPLGGLKQARWNLEQREKWLTLADISAFSVQWLLFEAFRDLDPKADDESFFKAKSGGPGWVTRIIED